MKYFLPVRHQSLFKKRDLNFLCVHISYELLSQAKVAFFLLCYGLCFHVCSCLYSYDFSNQPGKSVLEHKTRKFATKGSFFFLVDIKI